MVSQASVDSSLRTEESLWDQSARGRRGIIEGGGGSVSFGGIVNGGGGSGQCGCLRRTNMYPERASSGAGREMYFLLNPIYGCRWFGARDKIGQQ